MQALTRYTLPRESKGKSLDGEKTLKGKASPIAATEPRSSRQPSLGFAAYLTLVFRRQRKESDKSERKSEWNRERETERERVSERKKDRGRW